MDSPQSAAELDFGHPHAAGLVGCWPLVAGMGTLVTDHSGNGYHGTLTNMAGTEWVPSPYGYALNFPGTDDYVGVAGTSPLLKITGSMTCAALFLMPAAPATPYVLCKTVSAYTYLLQISGGGSQTFAFRTNLGTVSGPGVAGGLTPYVGKWILMAGRYDGAYQQVSVVKDGTITSWGSALSGAITANNDAFSIGNRAGKTNALLSPIVCAWVWDRYKTDRTLVELWERPWDMWSRPRRLWYVPTGGAYSVTIADALGMADDLTPVYAAIASLSDTLSVADAASVLAAYTTGIADGMGIAGAVGGVYSASVSIADAVGLAETITALWAGIVTIADTVQLSDAVTQAAAAYVVALADGMGIADAIVAAGAYTVTIADGITLADAIVAALPVSLSRQVLNILRTRHSISLTHVRHAIDILTD